MCTCLSLIAYSHYLPEVLRDKSLSRIKLKILPRTSLDQALVPISSLGILIPTTFVIVLLLITVFEMPSRRDSFIHVPRKMLGIGTGRRRTASNASMSLPSSLDEKSQAIWSSGSGQPRADHRLSTCIGNRSSGDASNVEGNDDDTQVVEPEQGNG
jgi:hypothetical protein